MAHHGQDEGPIQSEIFRKLRESVSHEALADALGDTGRYPQGQISPDDEGETKIAVGRKGDKVIIDFGTPTKWIGFDADQAIEIALLLARRAGEVKGVPISLRIGRAD